jgi:hypothetical protein
MKSKKTVMTPIRRERERKVEKERGRGRRERRGGVR